MKSVITFLLPGLAQLFSGDARKGGIMFASAVVSGMITGGIGYFLCGAWSVVDLQTRASGKPQTEMTKLLTTAEAPAAAGTGGLQMVMPWLFKFSVLGLCAFLVLNNVRSGGALQSLELFGVRLHFASLATEAGGAVAGGGEGDPASRQAAFDAVANAFQAEAGSAEAGMSKDGAEPTVPEALSNPSRGDPALEVGRAATTFTGQWNSDLGATYQIQEADGAIRVTETSKILFIPFISMTCSGEWAGEYVRSECTTYDGQTGELVLARDAAGGLGGVFTAHANGMQIPLNLRR